MGLPFCVWELTFDFRQVFQQLVLGLLVLVWTGVELERQARNPQPWVMGKHPLGWAVIGYLGWSLLSVAWGQNKAISVEQWVTLALPFVFMVLVSRSLKRQEAGHQIWGRGIALFALAYGSLHAVTVFLVHGVDYLNYIFGWQSNNFPELMLGLCIPVLLLSLRGETTLWRLVKWISLAAVALSLFVGLNPVLLLAGGLGALAMVATLFVLPKVYRSGAHKRKFMVRGIAAGITAVVLLTAFAYEKGSAPLPDNFPKLAYEHAVAYPWGMDDDPVTLRQHTASLIREHPLTGVGVGDWRIAVLGKAWPKTISWERGGEERLARLHNDFRHIAAETGYPGVILYALVFLFALLSVVGKLRRDPDPQSLGTGLWLIFGITGYLAYAVLVWPQSRMDQSVGLGILLGFVLHFTRNPQSVIQHQRVANLNLVVGGMIAVLALFMGTFQYLGLFSSGKAYKASRSQTLLEKSITLTDEALSPFYKLDPNGRPLTHYKADARLKLGHFEEANIQFTEALQVHPHYLPGWLGRAEARQKLEPPLLQGAENDLRQAEALAPDHPEVHLAFAQFFARQQNRDSLAYRLNRMPEGYENSALEEARAALNRLRASRLEIDPSDSLLSKLISDMRGNPEWINNMEKKAIEAGRSLDQQMLEDAFYILDQEGVEAAEIERLREVYGGK